MEVSMKQKKLIIVSAVLLLSAVGMFADTAIFVGPAFTNYIVRTKMDENLTGQIQNIVGDAIGNVKSETNNTAAFAIDLRGSFFYLMAQMAFPGSSHSDIVKATMDKKFNWNGIMLDTQLGGGITLFKESPLNLFVGAGAGLNTIYTKQELDATTAGLGKISYTRFDLMVGAGVNILASLYLAEHLGIYVGVADTVYFAPVKTQRLFEGTGLLKNINLTQSDQNSNVKNNFANSLNIKAGLTIKF